MSLAFSRLSKTPLAKLSDWLDERTGVRAAMRGALDEPIRGGARWAYVFGSLLLFLFLIQIITGIFLTMYYVPSSDHAHASVAYIQKAVPGGALLRGLHHYSASAMVILAVAHLAQTFLFGAYKRKRELVWVAGAVMLLLIFGFSFTGYLLPWDQAAYFGTKVGTSIAGEIPLVGPLQQRIMLGGSELTTLTLSRFFTAHVFLLPLVLGLMVALHVYLFRRAGPAGPFHERHDKRIDRFYPKQVFRDSAAMLLVFAALVALAYVSPAELGPEADPTSDYLARPPWYFLPLFQLLKYFPGRLSVIPTVVLPGALFTLIFLLPFIDRREERHPLRRPVSTASLILILLGAVGLIALSKHQDRVNPDFSALLKQQDEDARGFLETAFQPQEVGRAQAIPAKADPGLLAKVSEPPAAFAENCAECHGDHGEGDSGPALLGITAKKGRARDDLMKILNNSRSYGLKKPMPRAFPELSEEERRGIIEWLDGTRAK
ncbi:MAG TPA: cytochrome b N-terminal domain-containing protein [Blastocatellia bacterium]|nr:cytochrome b N-terminal domain-containing protein [Blastocatellia bacterium]